MKNVDRRLFIMVAGRAIPIAIGVPYLVACRDSADPITGPDDSNDNNNNVIRSISSVNAGHSHTATIPETDVASTLEKSYGSSSTSGHVHTVTFTQADFDTLRTAGQVTIESSSNSGHQHSFTFAT